MYSLCCKYPSVSWKLQGILHVITNISDSSDPENVLVVRSSDLFKSCFQTKLLLLLFNIHVKLHQLTNQPTNQSNNVLMNLCPHHCAGCHGDQRTTCALQVKEASVWRTWWSGWSSFLLPGSSTPSALRTRRASPCLKSNTPWSGDVAD